MITIIRNIFAGKQRHSSAKLLNREKKWWPFPFSNVYLWHHSADLSQIKQRW